MDIGAHSSVLTCPPGPSIPAMVDRDETSSDSDLDLPEDFTTIDPEVLFTLPPSVQYEVLLKMREKHFGANREKLVTLTGQPESFSDHQMQSYLKASKLRRDLEEIRQKSSCTSGNDAMQVPLIRYCMLKGYMNAGANIASAVGFN